MHSYNNYYHPKHFIMIPFEEENFLSNYKELCKKLISENPNNFNKGLLQKPFAEQSFGSSPLKI